MFVELDMKPLTQPAGWRDYALATVAVAGAGFLRVLLQPALAHEYEFTTLFLAVVVSSWKGGFGPGAWALALDCVVAATIHGFRNESVLPATASDSVGLLLYIIMGLSVAVLGEAQHRAVAALRAESDHREHLVGELAAEVVRREATQTELKQSQAELVVLNASLEQRVLERTNELTLALQELESFTYSIAHDMRAPLRAVNTTCRLIADEHGGSVDPLGRQLLDSALRAADFMNRFVDDLLEYARLARAPIRKSSIDLSRLVESTFEKVRKEDQTAELLIDPGMEVVSDPYLTESLFEQLIENAGKFKKADLPCKLRVEMRERADADEITINDEGIGFEMQYASRIFEPFQKLHPSGNNGGTGIGLAIAKRIVERLGGTIWAESEPGSGSSFHVVLPHRSQRNTRPVDPETLHVMAHYSEFEGSERDQTRNVEAPHR